MRLSAYKLGIITILHISALCLSLEEAFDEERLIGWKGETYRDAQSRSAGEAAHEEWSLASDGSHGTPWIETIAWSPRVFVYHNFLSHAEARHVKRAAAPTMKRSTVVGGNGTSVLGEIRTSYGTFVRRRHDPVVEGVLRRVAAWTRTPPVNQEDLQVLRYGVGQKYGAHTDSLIDDSPRMATVLLYLHDTEAGGETAFPDADAAAFADPSLVARLGPFSPCAEGRVAFRPRKGDALLFYSIQPDGTHDPKSLHTGCPVVAGVKWTATSWVHSMAYSPEDFLKTPAAAGERDGDPGTCADMHDMCDRWAAAGECARNPAYMASNCPRACAQCEPCAPGDAACVARNREALGFLVVSQEELDA